ncbi:hypothetical protein EPJ79_11395 [Brachyspira aalborgi]|uniref:DUF4276 family protein n=1 Tax=Brachyspira aalborgi TaxID=29522 RepID=A0A5C8CX37_9SPIR|nr:DUF3226 domain-containing protein [Brachyspira aalborgi]TXJ17755.1 hypothetical protein EPJ79_11395 [Brachyspira aalborgi]
MHILVEGHTDKDFLELYCKYLNIDVRIDIVDGKNNLINKPNLIRNDEKHLIIFDADDYYNDSKTNIENQINQMNIPKENYDIFLLPNNKDSGNLETLIEKIALYKEVLNCFEGYEECISKLGINGIKLPHKKSKVFAYMESFGFKNPEEAENFDLSPYVDFENKYLEDLKNFLLYNNE